MKKASLPDIKLAYLKLGNALFSHITLCFFFLHKYSHLLNNVNRTLTGFEKARRWLRYSMAIINISYNYALLLLNASLQFVEIYL